MNILVVCQVFWPDDFAINFIVKGLVERGHKVTVLTGLPDYSTSEIPVEYQRGKNRIQDYYGAKVYRTSIIPRKHGFVFRALNYISFAFNGSFTLRKLQKENFDLIYVWQTSPVTMAIPAILAKKKFHSPLVLYCLDIWPECVKAMGIQESSPIYKIIRRLSRSIYNTCDKIVVSSRPFIPYLQGIGCKRPMDYIPQFASEDFIQQDFSKERTDKTDFLFIGNMGIVQDLNCLIRAAAQFKDNPDVHFHFVGDGSEYESTVKLAESLGLDKTITFYGRVPFKEAKKYYYLADACILALNGDNHIGDTLPGKLQTYMAAGKPIIGAMNGAGKEVIQDSQCGICVSAGDTAGLAAALREFVENKKKYENAGDNAKQYFLNHFTEKNFFDAFLNLFLSSTSEIEVTN